jgi:hypothetical protein
MNITVETQPSATELYTLDLMSIFMYKDCLYVLLHKQNGLCTAKTLTGNIHKPVLELGGKNQVYRVTSMIMEEENGWRVK